MDNKQKKKKKRYLCHVDVYNLSTDHRCTVLSKHIQKAKTSEKEKYTV